MHAGAHHLFFSDAAQQELRQLLMKLVAWATWAGRSCHCNAQFLAELYVG